MTHPFSHFGIVGAGAWGTALGLALLRAGRSVTLWARRAEVAEAMNRTRENKACLPGIALDPALRATANEADLAACDAILLVTPAQHVRATGLRFAGKLKNGAPLILCAKGIEQATLALMNEVAATTLPSHPIAVLSGPTFAAEVARGLPTAVTLACEDEMLAKRLAEAIGSRAFRPYATTDVVGAEIGGAIKNVLAVACGIAEGRGMGDNARASIITRGLHELARLGVACGGSAETFMGLSGLGDLVLTCSGKQSRNMSLGIALGQGHPLAAILAERHSVAEGVFTAAAAVELAARKKIEMPIATAVDAILNHGASIDASIAALLARPFSTESTKS